MRKKIIKEDEIGQYFIYLSHLESLKIYFYRNLNGDYIKDLFNLKTLDVADVETITDKGIKNLISDQSVAERHLITLRELKLHQCHNITVDGIKRLKNLIKLEVNQCDNISSEIIKYLKSLECLTIDCCPRINKEEIINYWKSSNNNLYSFIYDSHICLNNSQEYNDEGINYL